MWACAHTHNRPRVSFCVRVDTRALHMHKRACTFFPRHSAHHPQPWRRLRPRASAPRLTRPPGWQRSPAAHHDPQSPPPPPPPPPPTPTPPPPQRANNRRAARRRRRVAAGSGGGCGWRRGWQRDWRRCSPRPRPCLPGPAQNPPASACAARRALRAGRAHVSGRGGRSPGQRSRRPDEGEDRGSGPRWAGRRLGGEGSGVGRTGGDRLVRGRGQARESKVCNAGD